MGMALWIRLAFIGCLFGTLELASRMEWINPISFIPPSRMINGAFDILVTGRYASDISVTIETIMWAVLLTVFVGLAGGIFLFKARRLRRVLDPILTSYYAVPIFIFYPLFIVMFGLNRLPLIATGFLFAVVAMMVNVLNGLERVPKVMLKVARLHRMSRVDEVRLIILPASLPYIFTGLKLTVAYATVAIIAGEFILSGAGFGYQIAFAYNNFENVPMYGLMVLLLFSVGTVNMILYAWEKRLYRRRVSR